MKALPSRLGTGAPAAALPYLYLPICHDFNLTLFLSLKTPFRPHLPVIIAQCRPHPLNFQNLNLTCPVKPISRASSSVMASSAATTTPSGPLSTEKKPFSVLFVCLGNICRSPAAEGVFRDLVKKRGFDSEFNIDSAGTIDYHEGNPADPRMRSAAKKRGVEITSISRPIRPSDFRDFDLILAMDQQNRADILEMFHVWKEREDLPADAHQKVKLMCSYCKTHDETEVPDPYYGGPQGFEKDPSLMLFDDHGNRGIYGHFLQLSRPQEEMNHQSVLDLLEDACNSLLDSIVTKSSGS